MLPSSCSVFTGEAHRLTVASRIYRSRNCAGPFCLETSLPRCSDIRLPMREGRHPAHVMSTFRTAFSLLLTALCQRRSRTGAQKQSPIFNSTHFRAQRAKWKTAPVPCARKRETDTEQTGKQRPGRNYLNLTYHRETTLIHAWAEKLRPAIPRGKHNPFIILCRDSLKAAMRVGYCVLHSQVAFVVQDATCAINHPSRVARVDVKGQVPQTSS